MATRMGVVLLLGWLACGCSDDATRPTTTSEAPSPTSAHTTPDEANGANTNARAATTSGASTTANGASTTANVRSEPPASLRRPPPLVDPTRSRALRDEVRELRRLVGSGDVATAAPRFVALATREAGNARLHCEAGFVALRADDFASAETQIEAGLAVFRRSGAIATTDRVPYAMCLYNRGRLAQVDGDRHLAIASYQQSLALRPNATVEAKLREAEAMPEEAEEEEVAEAPTVTRTPVAGGAPTRTAVLEHAELPDQGVEEGCFEDSVVVRDPIAGEHSVVLVGACPETFSIFRDFGFTQTPEWVDAGAPYGHVLTVHASHGGRGDDEDGLVSSESETLFVIAVVDGAWKVAAIPIGGSVATDCDNDPCDDPDTSEDDDQGFRPERSASFHITHRIADGAITLTMARREGEIEAPEPGRRTLAEAFAEWAR